MIPTTPQTLDGYPAHIVAEPAKTQVLRAIKDLVRTISPHGKFPGPNPCSLERADLGKFRTGKWWLCEKTDGTRILLVFLTFDGTKAAFLVTRAWDVFVVGIRQVPKALFQGTVFDGELVHAGDSWTWLGFDAVVVSGIPVWSLPLSERLKAAGRGMTAYVASPKDSLVLRFKNYYATFAEYEASLPGSVFKNDGTVITPEEPPVILGRHQGLFKLKTAGKHTVDFELSEKSILSVWCPKQNRCVEVGKLVLSPHQIIPPPGSIIEATWNQKEYWNLVCVRSDKNTSNDMLTFTKTMINIRENMTLSDLKNHF